MNGNTHFRFGGIAAVLAGIAMLIGGTSYLLYPTELLFGPPTFYWRAVTENEGLLQLTVSFFTLWSLLSLAVVLAFAEFLQVGDRLLIRWASLLAIIGLSVYAVSSLYSLNETLWRALGIRAYGEGSVGATLTSGMTARTLDPYDLLGFGLVGFWLLVINWVALRQDGFPRVLAWVGIASGIACWLYVASNMPTPFESSIFTRIPQVAAVTLGPIWFIWSGVVLYRNRAAEPTAMGTRPTAAPPAPLGAKP